MSNLIQDSHPIDDAPRRTAATARITAPDWMFSAVIHLLLIAFLFASKAGPGGSGDDSGGGHGTGDAGEGLSDRWIEAQMGSDPGSSVPAPLAIAVIENAQPLTIPEPAPIASENEAVPVPSPTGIEQTSYTRPDSPSSVQADMLPPDVTMHPSLAGDGVSGGNGVAGAAGDGDGSPGDGGDGQGGTSLFGIWDAGERFVYVIDRSSSMAHYGKLAAARSELGSSLERLEESIEFHVLLYNQEVQPLNTRGSHGLVRATVINRNQILRQLRVVLPDGGTQHRGALQAALRLRPTVVYFLTDAEDPGLTPSEIDTLARQLRGATRIHCIQFGEIPGRPPTDGNWLQQLADATGGKYVHVRTDALRTADGNSRPTR